jgi:predicted secreted protein
MGTDRPFRRAPSVVAVVAVALAAVVLLAACGGGSSTPSAHGTRTFTDPGKRIEVKLNQVFEVHLSANAGTGYSWRVGQTTPALVKEVGARYDAPKTSRAGAPGTAILRFRATARGEGGLGLAYVAPGRNGAVARTTTFEIKVG